MSAITVARSSLTTSLARYSRSWGLWVLLVIALIGARFMVGRDDGTAITIAVNNHMPVMTSAVIGTSLGIIVSTLLLPVGYIYLRSNTTRRQPWQVEEVSPASRIAIALGRFAADAAIFGLVLAALTVAGCILGLILLPRGTMNPFEIAFALWVIAGPAVMGLAAIRILFDALPFARGAFGDFLCFVLWMASIVAPAATEKMPASYAANMYDFAGFLRPLVHTAPGGGHNFGIGGIDAEPGRIPLDAIAGILSPGYLGSRLTWALIAIAVAAFAGLVYRPHRVKRQRQTPRWAARWFKPRAVPAADHNAPAASRTRAPILGLIVAEFRLIASWRLFAPIAVLIALAGLFADFRHAVSPAALLLLTFGLTSQAGRTEARGLLTLTGVTASPPWLRRACFVVAGFVWSMLMSAPAIIVHGASSLTLAAQLGSLASLTAMALSAISGSAFAARVALLIAWYGYLSS